MHIRAIIKRDSSAVEHKKTIITSRNAHLGILPNGRLLVPSIYTERMKLRFALLTALIIFTQAVHPVAAKDISSIESEIIETLKNPKASEVERLLQEGKVA